MLKQHSQLVGQPPLGSLRRRLTSDNYDRKLKPTAKKTRKHDKKRRKHLKAALLALGMLAIIPGMIAGSALTESTKQVSNVVTQVSFAYCGYRAATGGSFLGCMGEFWIPSGAILGTSTTIGVVHIEAGVKLESWRLIRTGLCFLGVSGKGFVFALA